MVDALVGAGGHRKYSKLYAATLVGKLNSTTFMEVYGRGSIVAEANKRRRKVEVRGIGAMDLRTSKPDGTPWNFSLKEDRRLARKMIDEEKPDWIIGSPPCTAFSIWNYSMNYPKMDPGKVAALVLEGERHLKFMAGIYRRQHERGKFFLHEHPAGARSWHVPVIKNLWNLRGVDIVRGVSTV